MKLDQNVACVLKVSGLLILLKKKKPCPFLDFALFFREPLNGPEVPIPAPLTQQRRDLLVGHGLYKTFGNL